MTRYEWPDPQRQTAIPIAREGIPLIGGAAFVTATFALLELTFPALGGLLVSLFLCYFFRDPDRVVPHGDEHVLSPADGKVIRVEPATRNPFGETASLKISIFMSVFNVHVNRMPISGQVLRAAYHPGKFVNASFDKASADNERNALEIAAEDGRTVTVVQIAGLVARRIICRVQENDSVRRGQRFGLICFGSRLDLYLPAGAEPRVAVGQRVQAGSSIVATLPLNS